MFRPHRSNTARRWLVLALLLVAGQQLAGATVIQVKAHLAQRLIGDAWAQTLATRTVGVKPWPWADTWPVARLRVPAGGIDQWVLAGIGGHALAFGPGMDPATVPPGEPGMTVIAGHRDTHFSFLPTLEPGAELTLQLADGRTLGYRVSRSDVVDTRSDSTMLSHAGPPRLLLVTCYPFNTLQVGGPLRYVVQALPQLETRS